MADGQITAFAGIDNRRPLEGFDNQRGAQFVRDAVNVDLNAALRFQRRPGYERVVEASHCRSLWSEDGVQAYYAAGSELRRFDGVNTSAVAALASPLAEVAYAAMPDGVAWSDGFTLNVIRAGVSAEIVPRLPNPLPSVAAAAGGSLRAGGYGVCFASRAANGRRSPLSLPVFVDVPENGRIEIQAAAHTLGIDYFVTARNGEVFYRAGTIAVGETTADVVLEPASGEPIVHQVTAPLPPGSVLSFHRGRLLSAAADMLRYSLPYNVGIYRPASDWLHLPGNVALIASVAGGLYLATAATPEKAGETWFLPGGEISAAEMVSIAPYGAVPGTLTKIPNSNDLMWFTPRGALRAGQDGTLKLLQDQHMAFGPSQSGAAVLREENGMRTLITALSGTKPTGGAVVGSFMDAVVVAL